MRVIEKGSGQKGWAGEFRCTGAGNGNGGCGALLMVEQGDIYKTHNYDYGGGHEVYTTFRCPECSSETDIKVPSSVKVREKEREPDYDYK